jgi:hypothetical protein
MNRFVRVASFLVVVSLGACDGPPGNRPQDKRMMQRQQQLNQVIQGLERGADQVVGRGHQAFLDVKRSGEEIAADAGKRMQQLAEASDEVANKTKRLEQVAAGVQGGSQEVLDFARKAAGYVGLSQEPVSTDKTP